MGQNISVLVVGGRRIPRGPQRIGASWPERRPDIRGAKTRADILRRWGPVAGDGPTANVRMLATWLMSVYFDTYNLNHVQQLSAQIFVF